MHAIVAPSSPDRIVLNSPPTPPTLRSGWFNWVQLRRNYSSTKHLIVPQAAPVLLSPTSTMYIHSRSWIFEAAGAGRYSLHQNHSLSLSVLSQFKLLSRRTWAHAHWTKLCCRPCYNAVVGSFRWTKTHTDDVFADCFAFGHAMSEHNDCRRFVLLTKTDDCVSFL